MPISTNGAGWYESAVNRWITVIDFLHVQHLQPAVGLPRLLEAGVLRGAPQSVTSIPRTGLAALFPSMNFGFAL